MFRTTLVNCDVDAGTASVDLGSRPLGKLEPHAVIAVLEKFRAIDPIQNATVDPEVILETSRRKHHVRTGQGKLFLYDTRDSLAPALVLTSEEIVAELDGSATRSRSRAAALATPLPEAEPIAAPISPTPVSSLRPAHRLALAAAAIALGAYVGQPYFSSPAPSHLPAYELVQDAKQAEATRTEVAGVYLTGSTPGNHGISLGADGSMKLFQINIQGSPSFLQDTYRVARAGGRVCVVGQAPGRLIQISGKQALSYGGETYQRLP
jgi:hypothetical protein